MARVGKLNPDELIRYVLRYRGTKRDDVVLPPKLGEDAAVVRLPDGGFLVTHLDPITAAGKLAGWLAVHVACNDVAVTGARPSWLEVLLIMPPGEPLERLEEIMRQVDEAAREVGAAIVGGHTEYNDVVTRPLVAVTAFGYTRRYIPTSGAKPGDYIVMTKTAAVEGTAILATDFEDKLKRIVGEEVVEKAKRFLRKVSVVREALILAEAGVVDAMHDPTEGGVIGGILEMCYASNLEAEIWVDEIPVAEETRLLCEALGVNPLKLISSGVLLASVPEMHLDEAIQLLKRVGVGAKVVGRFHEGEPKVKLVKGGVVVEIVKGYVEDEIYRLASLKL